MIKGRRASEVRLEGGLLASPSPASKEEQAGGECRLRSHDRDVSSTQVRKEEKKRVVPQSRRNPLFP